MYEVKTKSDNIIKKNVDQLRFRHIDTEDAFDRFEDSEDSEDLFDDWKNCPSSPLVPSQTPDESDTCTGGTLRRLNRVCRPVTT